MLIKDALNIETRQKLIKLFTPLYSTKSVNERTKVKGEYYADSIVYLRTLSKRELTKWIRNTKNDKDVKLAYSINNNYIYRKLNTKTKQKVELINYAYNLRHYK